MKIAKASKRDIDAAGELLSILNAIDAQFGGPFLHEDAPEDLLELLGDGDFDPDNQLHLQVLYNHLARLLDKVPSFHNRIIGGMCYVIMYEANEIVDPDSDVLDLHPKLKAALADAGRLQAEREQLASKIHYPDCWDTAVYPDLSDALHEIGCNRDCCTRQTRGGAQ